MSRRCQEVSRRCHGGVTEVSPRCHRGVTELSPRCHEVSRGVKFCHVLSYGCQNADTLTDTSQTCPFVPQGETLQLPNGKPWHLRDAIPFEVFAREVQRAASSKAPAMHAFLVDHLQLLPGDHPTLDAYYQLLMRCMESGVYPAHYLELVAVLIPKTYGNHADISALRDIWLINHGAKLAERFILHLGLADRFDDLAGHSRGYTTQAQQ